MSQRPLVLKIGGSLRGTPAESLCFDLANTSTRDVVIVPGGGSLAENVRTEQTRLHFSDAEAHRLAILAMHSIGAAYENTYSFVKCVSNLVELRSCWSKAIIPVWQPWPMVENAPDLPQDWSVTSDGLAAWLAVRIPTADVALIKSCAIPDNATPATLAADGIVDPTFARIVWEHALAWQLINGSDLDAQTKLTMLLSP